MAHLYCHQHPDVLVLATRIVNAVPGKVLLEETPFYPGGGGQPPDLGVIRTSYGETKVIGFEYQGPELWHLTDSPVEIPGGVVEAAVDGRFRTTMKQLHTDTHILNAFVYAQFNGALVTGVQIYGDGTARMDFDIPEANNDILRALEAPINDTISKDLDITFSYVPVEEAVKCHGLIRSRSVAPPPTLDGRIRIVEIAGLDRQACGGTHLASTGGSPPIKILKIENKGRHNRRIRIGLSSE